MQAVVLCFPATLSSVDESILVHEFFATISFLFSAMLFMLKNFLTAHFWVAVVVVVQVVPFEVDLAIEWDAQLPLQS